jgi:hypothetical protein
MFEIVLIIVFFHKTVFFVDAFLVGQLQCGQPLLKLCIVLVNNLHQHLAFEDKVELVSLIVLVEDHSVSFHEAVLGDTC